jgi:iron(III) transport system substrate-binding protein
MVKVLAASYLLLAVACFGADPAHAAAPWGPLGDIETAARKEGQLVVYSAPGHISQAAQQAIGQLFQEKYGIGIEWTTMSARDISPRVIAEQTTKQYVVDIAMSGIAGNYTEMKPRGYVVPILAPSTLDKGVWRLDPATAFPKDRDWLFINMPVRPTFLINTNMVRPGEEPKSYKDLLDPKWKGKIVLQQPWSGGTGSGWFRAVYRTLGVEYMKALAKQVVLVANVNDSVDPVVRSQYPISISASPERARRVIQEGAPVRYLYPSEGGHLSVQGIEMIAKAPHSNAAKLFFHWFYTREGQSIYAPKTLAISVRKDVPQDYIPPDERYAEGQSFLMPTPEDFTVEKNKEITKLAGEIFDISR